MRPGSVAKGFGCGERSQPGHAERCLLGLKDTQEGQAVMPPPKTGIQSNDAQVSSRAPLACSPTSLLQGLYVLC